MKERLIHHMNRKQRREKGKRDWKEHKKRVKTANAIQVRLLKDLAEYEGMEKTPELEEAVKAKVSKALTEIERRTGFSLQRKPAVAEPPASDAANG